MKILLFDLDGTLVKAGGAGRKALDAAVRALYGVRGSAFKVDLAGKTDLRCFAEVVEHAVGRKPTRAEIRVLCREYLRRLPGFVRAAVRDKTYALTPGIRRLLSRLGREEELLLGLGTGNLESAARIKLAPSGLNGCFAFGGFGSDAFHRPAILKKGVCRARAHLGGAGRGLRPEDVYVIGDTPLDVAAGKAAGYRTIAVGTGFASWEELVRSRPDHLARDFKDVRRWLRWLRIPVRTGRKRQRG